MVFAVFAVTLTLIIADVTTWLELDVATIFGLPLLLAGAMRNQRLLWILTGFLIITTFVVYFIQIPSAVFTLREPFFLNRVLDAVELFLMAGLLHIWMTSAETSETQEHLIKVQSEKLKAAEVAQRLIEVQKTERRMIANHLHDLVGQNLTVLGINLKIMENQLSCSQAMRIRVRLDNSHKLIEETIEIIRDVIAELRPAVLDDYGLIPALRWYAGHFAKQTDVVTAVNVKGLAHRFLPVAEEALFRIAQEALTNVAKYAGTQNAIVTLNATSQNICLTIADNGCGFDPTEKSQPDKPHGWGLRIMHERAAEIGAQLSVESAPGHGTKVKVILRCDS